MNPSVLEPETDQLSVSPLEHCVLVDVRFVSVRELQASLLQQRLMMAADHAAGRVVVNFRAVQDTTAGGLAALVAAADRCRALGGRLVVYGLQHEIERAVRLAGLDESIGVAADMREAVRMLEGESPRRLFGLFHGRRSAA